MNTYDIIIIGAGAAGLSAAATALARGRRVAVFDMGTSPARKVLASGGGRCNITNTAAGYDRYAGNNPNFVRGALSRVSPRDVLDWATEHGIGLHEKTPGRYFCNDGAGVVVDALLRDAHGADFFYNQTVSEIKKSGDIFQVNSAFARAVIIATGGISFGTLGVSDAGYKIAKQFGHKIAPVRPALCALNVAGIPSDFAGISIDAEITIGKRRFSDSLLLTHSGIGGPLAYRVSLFDIQNGFTINWVPDVNILDIFKKIKQQNGRKTITGIISEYLPTRIARWVVGNDTRNVADVKDTELIKTSEQIHRYKIPAGNAKYHSMTSAEVTFGGVDTNEISSKTMESKLCPGLFFAGEVIDVTGDLGGFNLQWAWASGRVAGMNA
ncbi:MAG: aminoacetone oxidase family FAD-binding enzyme [Alphaproteobacteria bacterium]|nr:aminoacetone oxidase family FAD-binding enzyme [Alphaproteobacteria bacterium]